MKNSIPLSQDDFRALYLEVIGFLNSLGGIYRSVSRRSCARILYCLDHGQYYLKRDQAGKISHFCAFYHVAPQDLALVSKGEAPAVTSGGSVLFVAEHGSLEGRDGMRALVRWLREKSPGCQGVAWWHKGRSFKYFAGQRGGA